MNSDDKSFVYNGISGVFVPIAIGGALIFAPELAASGRISEKALEALTSECLTEQFSGKADLSNVTLSPVVSIDTNAMQKCSAEKTLAYAVEQKASAQNGIIIGGTMTGLGVLGVLGFGIAAIRESKKAQQPEQAPAFTA